jgi:20S proteasome subunit beta 5
MSTPFLGPRLSDLKDIDNMLKEISFKENPGEPLKPFEQLMACLPPSSADLLPKPYQWLMKSAKSPIIDFYPDSFTIDMNGKRWPWEAVVLLPFIDSKRLIESSRKMVPDHLLTDDEKLRNQLGDALVYTRDEQISKTVPALNDRPNFGLIEECNVLEKKYNDTSWKDEHLAANSVLRPELLPGTIVPYPGFPTLRDAPVHGLTRRKLGINVFGMRSRYRTAVLQLDREIPMIASAEAIAGKFIGTTLYFRYPFLQEGFVTAVSDADVTVRGKEPARKWSDRESQTWKLKNDTIKRQYETGEGLTGSGGWNVPESEVTLSIRPLKEIETLKDGSKVKVYARLEVEVPMVAAIWSPSNPDPRFTNIPARLEKNPYRFGSQPPPSPTVSIKGNRRSLRKSRVTTDHVQRPTTKILPDFNSNAAPKTSILPPTSIKNGILGSTSNFSTLARPAIARLQTRKISNLSQSSIGTNFRKFSQRRTPSRGMTAVAALAAACFVKGANASILPDSFGQIQGLPSSLPALQVRGGEMDWKVDILNSEEEESTGAPPLEFAHGTTTLSFIYDGGILAAVDSRASMGNFVGSKTTQKVLPINDYMLGTMAGGAADCSFWIRKLQAESRHYELAEGRPITVARVSRLLADCLYANRNSDLSVGTMIMGYDEQGPSIYYVDNKGTRIGGDLFSVGSGSTFALGVLDTERLRNMKEDEAINLGIKAIRHATFRDAFSGGYIAVYVITKEGWRKVFSEDLALSMQT